MITQRIQTVQGLEPTKANFPALEHAINFSFGNKVLNVVGDRWLFADSVGDVVITFGVAAPTNSVTQGINIYSSKSAAVIGFDVALESGSWVQPNTKTALIVNMSDGNFIVGASGAGFVADGLRVNVGAAVGVADFSTTTVVNATAGALTGDATIIAHRSTPTVDVNSIEANASTVTVNVPVANVITTIDGLNSVTGLAQNKAYYGVFVLYFDNPPSDTAIAHGIAFMRNELLKGNFVLPSSWARYS